MACRLAGQDPRSSFQVAEQHPEQQIPQAVQEPLTIARAFELYLGPKGPSADVSREPRRRYERTQRHAIALLGANTLASSLNIADLTGYANNRREAIAAQSRRPSKGGARQAEIEVVCVLAVLNWLATSYGAHDVKLTRAPELLKSLRAGQAPDQPRFSDDEKVRLEKAIGTADPRLVLLLTIQGAQRAGQLLRCRRSQLVLNRTDPNLVRATLWVSGCRTKKGGRHVLPPSAARYLLACLKGGFLRELEQAYLDANEDYYLFPGCVGRLSPGSIVAPGKYPAWDRSVALDAFKELELAAKVPHISKRGFHGFRRRAVDVLGALGATPAELQAAGNWATSQIPMEVYRSGVVDADAERAAELLERAAFRAHEPIEDEAGDAGTTTASIVSLDYPETDPHLAQILRAKNLTDAEIDEVLELTKWAWVELNYRPHAYQRTPPAQSLRHHAVFPLTDRVTCPKARVGLSGPT